MVAGGGGGTVVAGGDGGSARARAGGATRTAAGGRAATRRAEEDGAGGATGPFLQAGTPPSLTQVAWQRARSTAVRRGATTSPPHTPPVEQAATAVAMASEAYVASPQV